MDTKAAENYLRNTEMKFKFKAGSAMAIALTLLVTIILEEIIGMPVHPLEDVYFIGGIILLVVTGGIVKVLKIAAGVFTWGYLLTPLLLFDIAIAITAGGFVLIMQILFPFIPIALDTLGLYKERQNAKMYL